MTLKQASLERWRSLTRRKKLISQKTINQMEIAKDNVIQTSNVTLNVTINAYQTKMAQPENNQFDMWGDSIKQKGKSVCRLVLRNVNSLPQESNHNKNDMLINELLLLDADVYCANEINIGWQNIELKHRVRERFKGKLEYAKFITSNNKDTNYTGSYQPGGTMMIVNGNICGRVYESGTEENTLQRWSWIKLRGKQNKNVVIVTVYRPVRSQGPTSAYQQHKSILLSNDIDDCPRIQILSS
jgi:hypothetical protein